MLLLYQITHPYASVIDCIHAVFDNIVDLTTSCLRYHLRSRV
jgi:hypothetical protein